MHSKTLRLIGLLACLTIALPVLAQFGYPLKGSWSGDWWLKKGEENHVLLEFNWDGKTLTGTLNPGTDNVALQIPAGHRVGNATARRCERELLQSDVVGARVERTR